MNRFTLFGSRTLVILICVVTFLLQLISFATTWSGSKIYLDGVFPHASLLFAIAIQAIAYFFSNSLRDNLNPLKTAALCTALCCSTYYSYIGIYNSVNSPTVYLQENYHSIGQKLEGIFYREREGILLEAQTSVNEAASCIASYYASLAQKEENAENCLAALSDSKTSYTSNLRPPKQSSYENYEDYAAAYQAYIREASKGISTEEQAYREQTLAAFGYASMEELSLAEADTRASMTALETALGATVTQALADLSRELYQAITDTTLGQPLTTEDTASLNRLFQAASLCGYDPGRLSDITASLHLCAEGSSSVLLADYETLVAGLPEGRVTAANTMDLKSAMDSEILNALLCINSLLPETKQLSLSDPQFQITDLYLIPVEAFCASDTRMTAFLSLGVAALIDGLSVLFALSLRDRKPVFKKRTLLFNRMEDYAPLIYSALPKQGLEGFLVQFRPSPRTEKDGFMLMAPMTALDSYHTLAALLCQINLARIVPSGFWENQEELLLLRARFVFWAGSMIAEKRGLT
ncbi:MAG: hypothetical protein J6C84_01065 [Lachnospiraceae bacterium]|nr:hypothetical protein [Lachnospiraceae bacterium]